MTRDAVLLLGGEGFIGSALLRRLQKERRPVHVVGRKNITTLKPLLAKCGTVFHLASATTPGSSANDIRMEDDNLRLTHHVADLLRRQAGTHLIYLSSGGTVYGNPAVLPVTEDAALAPLSNYGTAKIEQEKLCTALREYGTTVTVLRPSNAYGPGQSLKTGFGLIRTLLEHAYRGTPVEIWGDGTDLRDYIYIIDLVEAAFLVCVSPDIQGTFNLGSASGHSINDVKSMVEAVCKVHIDATRKPSRSVDVRSVVLDTSRLRERIVWAPTVTLEEGIRRTWQWMLK
jgi:UDP-glucose 4-epimerase